MEGSAEIWEEVACDVTCISHMEYPVWIYKSWPKIHSFILLSLPSCHHHTYSPRKLPSGVFLLFPSRTLGLWLSICIAVPLGEPWLLSPQSNHKLPKGRLAASYPFLNSWPVQALHSGSIHQQEGRPRFVERGQLGPFRIWFNKRLLKAHTMPGTVLVLLLTSYSISKKHHRIARRA